MLAVGETSGINLTLPDVNWPVKGKVSFENKKGPRLRTNRKNTP